LRAVRPPTSHHAKSNKNNVVTAKTRSPRSWSPGRLSAPAPTGWKLTAGGPGVRGAATGGAPGAKLWGETSGALEVALALGVALLE